MLLSRRSGSVLLWRRCDSYVFPVSWITTNIFLWMAWGEIDSPRGGTGSGQSLMSTSASFCWRKFCTLLPVTLNLVIKVQQTSLYRHYINHSQTLFTLTFRSVSETFVRRSCSILLPVLATVVMWRGKKSVVRVTQCIAVLIPVHRTPSLLSDVHCFLNASGTSIRLSIQDCRFWPVDYMVVMACIISQSWFILFWQTGQTLTSCEWFTCCCFHFCLVFFQSCPKLPPSLTYASRLTVAARNFVHTVCDFFLLSFVYQ